MRQATAHEIEQFAQRMGNRAPGRDDCWVCAGQGTVRAVFTGKVIRCGECDGLEAQWRIERREREAEREVIRTARKNSQNFLDSGRGGRYNRDRRGGSDA